MPRPLQLLLVEDNPLDAERVISELRQAGFEPAWQRVETEADYVAALRPELDLIISDFSLPQFSGPRALTLLKTRGWEIPFLLVSGSIGEEIAVEAVKGGATDYLLKDRLSRLGPVVRRALEEVEFRQKSRRAADELQNSELQYRLLFESNPQPMWVFDLESLRFLAVNDAAVLAYGYTRAEFLAMTVKDIRPPEELPFLAEDLAARDTAHSLDRTWTHRRKDGTLLQVRITAHGFRFGDRPARLVMVHDETARLLAQDEARRTQAQLQQMLDHSPVVFYRSKLGDGKLAPEIVSENIIRLLGAVPSETLGQEWWWEQLDPADRARATASVAETLQQGAGRTEYRLRHKDGSFRWVEDSRQLIHDANGRPSGFVGVWTDISERKRAEEVLLGTTSNLGGRDAKRAFKEISLVLLATVLTAVFLDVSDVLQEPIEALSAHYNHIMDEFVGTLAVLLVGAMLFGYRRWREAHSQVVQGHHIQRALRTLHGELDRRVQLRTTELAKANDVLRTSEERFRQLAENVTEVFWLVDPAKPAVLYVSPAYETIWGRTCASLLANAQGWLEAIHPDDRERVRRSFKTQASGNYAADYRIVRPDGAIRWIHDRAFPVRNEAGEVYRIAGVAQDVTEKKQMESQFYRAQRLESIGTLASGIAHDLNNILAPIMMSTGLIRVSSSPKEAERMLATIDSSAERGAQLVRQLLTFGRGEEGGAKHALPLAPLVAEMEEIARQTFPKNVRVETAVAADLPPALVDSTQVHQILLNLCVNARDAMPDGGTLRLGADFVRLDEPAAARHPGARAGDYVRLSVIDTGSGMTPEIMDKIFDPFFTTKEIGKGTGLGLATVLGLVKSHGGFMTLTSEVGHGSTFQVYLPANVEGGSAPPMATPSVPRRGQGELILVVDDEETIRDMVGGALIRQGYTAELARDGLEGLARYHGALAPVQLVITDCDMPRMDGITMMKALRAMNPRLKFLVSSGLANQKDGVRQAELKELGAESILEKPYTVEKLLDHVGRALAGSRAPFVR